MAALLAEDVRASLLPVGDLNGHRQEWLANAIVMVCVVIVAPIGNSDNYSLCQR